RRADPELHEGAARGGAADGGRGQHPGAGRAAAVHLSRLPDGQRGEARRAARRPAAQDVAVGHAAAALRASVLAVADARHLR
nr:hypothetical protein [Tanacetum cinerariifolium]